MKFDGRAPITGADAGIGERAPSASHAPNGASGPLDILVNDAGQAV